ncbi:hypothetical protein BDP27DRAFT_1421670 [Rhodocollybia butyracea]|uniref:Malate dehydrogenase n=1 Tax=Rhodocollybia butyracea TaxID=206335 RepID=A0A9P5PV69_9AGAR|nr:hypothetical protein BDP27DRAFT_1421670 [Rhodocollybia butyracea]
MPSVLKSILALPILLLLVAGSPSNCRERCGISKAVIDTSGTTLPPPSYAPSFIGLGVGTQNYTCGSTGTYTNVGALAQLFDASCLVGHSSFTELAATAFEAWNSSESADLSGCSDRVISQADVIKNVITMPVTLGYHYFVTNPKTGSLSPEWDFTDGAFAGDAKAYVVASKIDDDPAPTGVADIDWLYLTNPTGTLAQEIYRVDTKGGQPPASCIPGSAEITVKYTSMYWLMGGSF